MSREPVTFTTEAALDRPDLAADSDPERSTLTAAATTEISALLATLPDRDRDILIMRVVQGMSALDTGRVLDMTTGAVRVAQHRALAKMRRILPAETMARRPCHAGRSGRADTHRTRTMRTDTAYTVGRGGADP
jgi:DNA-directed RNA polymerase specialized sigma24 family protein